MLNINRCCIKDKTKFVEDRLYVGRANKTYGLGRSPLANPYVVGVDGDRKEVIRLYRQWLWKQVCEKPNDAWNELCWILRHIKEDRPFEAETFSLACWCHPDEKCHADIIINCLNWMNNNNLGKIEEQPNNICYNSESEDLLLGDEEVSRYYDNCYQIVEERMYDQ